ncbi:hypothetical protein ACIRVK_35060 [Streptomyces sp. NPDC101152]|uniref:hypothetical protein n=1 Tax=Streptomyces sp. NPDC101152 TaxID=3366116 RepID=UPI003815D285
MPTMLAVVAGVLGAVLAVINSIQVFLGRQLINPSASRRSAQQLRTQSAAAAVAMLGVSLAGFGALLGGFWRGAGALIMLAGWTALLVTRRRHAQHP